jgi:hypothetical protein
MSCVHEHAKFFIFALHRVGRARMLCLIRSVGPRATPHRAEKIVEVMTEVRFPERGLPGIRAVNKQEVLSRHSESAREALGADPSGVLHTKRPRWQTRKPVKASAEVTLVRKACLQGDLRQAEVGRRKKFLRQK